MILYFLVLLRAMEKIGTKSTPIGVDVIIMSAVIYPEFE
jgi:hypothetical protein